MPVQEAEETREQLEARLDATYEKRYKALLDIWKREEFQKLMEDTESRMQQMVLQKFEEWKKGLKPPTKEEIEQLLSQDYLSFTIKLHTNGDEREFVISELPQSAEKRFYKQFKGALAGKASEFAAIAQRDMDQGIEKKFKSLLELVDGGFDLLADACVIVLNPRGEDKDITRDWCTNNLSSSRMWNIVKAQIEVNRLRDFFSQLSLSGTQVAQMIPGGSPVSSLR